VKTISIRELHARTGKWVREAVEQGQILVADNGRTVVRTAPEAAPPDTPYFARRRFINREMKRLIESGELGRGGTDVTTSISEDREDRAGFGLCSGGRVQGIALE
jgi:antitoxin (DNA-binding transcriptional repressor) of toxin-antitoxin stability system